VTTLENVFSASNFVELPLSGLDGPMSEVERMVQESVHGFAKDVLRPVSAKLDRLSADELVAPGSELHSVLEQSAGLGLDLIEMQAMEPLERARLLAIAIEELSWGCAGLAGAILVSYFPSMFSLLAGNREMAEFTRGKTACWAITEPEHGSDMIDAHRQLAWPGSAYGRPSVVARFDGDDVVLNGQKSAWVSGAPVADCCVLYTKVQRGSDASTGISLVLDLRSPGVSKGRPLEKMGLRAMSQGELIFEDVRVPRTQIIANEDVYEEFLNSTLAEANPHVAGMSMGIARAAYEHAHAYAHERRAGGVPLVFHQHIRYRLFHMFRKVELARAMLMRVITYNATATRPALQASAAAKVSVTQLAFEVANEALQMFGGNGLTHEYPMEKLLRDARALLIADGCNEMLALKGGTLLVNPELA
jgi:alkylation response protein AidB-like acyl-CoA dehydrogenase